MSDCRNIRRIPGPVMDASMCRYLKAPAGSVSELYERYPSGAERGAFALVLGDNMFYAYHVEGEYRGQWRPVGGDASSGGNDPGGNNPGGNTPGGNNPGNTDPGGNDPGGSDPADPDAPDIIFSGIVTDGTNPVSGVLVKVPTSASTQIGESITDSEGRYRVAWEGVTESDYADITLSFRITTSKEGYVDSLFSIQKPTYSSAVTDGITINAVIEASEVAGPSEFSVSPGSIIFPWNSTTVGVDVVCPDTAWEVVSNPDFVTLQVFKGTGDRQNFITVGTSSNNTTGEDRTGEVVVRWQGRTVIINVTQIAQAVSEGVVVFRGRVMDGSTNTPLFDALVDIKVGGSSAATTIGSVRTDSNGNFTCAWQVDAETWGRTGVANAVAEKAGYTSNHAGVNTYVMYDIAVIDGIAVDTITLNPAESPFSLSTSRVDFGRNGGAHDVIVTSPDSTWQAFYYSPDGYIPLPLNDDVFEVTRLNDTTIRVVGKGNTSSSNFGKEIRVGRNGINLTLMLSHYNT